MNNELENLKKIENKLIKKLNKIAKRDKIMNFFYEERSFLDGYDHGHRYKNSIAGLIGLLLMVPSVTAGLLLCWTNPWIIPVSLVGIGVSVGIGILPGVIDKISLREIGLKQELEQVQTRIEAIEKGITIEELKEQRKEEKKQQELFNELQEEKERLLKRKKLLTEAEKRRTLKNRAEGLLSNLEKSNKEKADQLRKDLDEVEKLETDSNVNIV